MFKRKAHSDLNMIEGPLLVKILIFTLPLMATNLLQTFYNAADMMVVSLSSEPNSVGAIGATGPMINLVLNIFLGLGVGANVIVARKIGSRDDEQVSKALHTAMTLSVILGIMGMIVGIIIDEPALRAMGAQDNLLELAALYTRIYFFGVPFISITNFAIAIFRARGDTKTPLIVLTITGFANVLMNFLFVLAFEMTVDGVALATLLSNAMSATILVTLMVKDKGICHFSFKKIRIDSKSFKEILLIGIPASLQGALFSISNIMIQSSILKVNNMKAPVGEKIQPVMNGNSAMANLEGFIYTATNSVYQASVTFTSQNVGAGKYRRVYRVMGSCYFITGCIAIIFSGIIAIFKNQLLLLYGVSSVDTNPLQVLAYESAITRMYYVAIPYILLAFMEVGSGILRGLGKSLTSTIVSFIGSCLLRIIWLLTVFRAYMNLEMVYVSYPISWALTALISLALSLVILRKKIIFKEKISKLNI